MPASRSSRRWWIVLGILAAAAAAQQIAIIIDMRANPLARTPILDARAYWERAGEIAGGQWRDSTPFMGAPLYPYLLAAIRALGGGISAAVGTQVVMHLATIVLIAVAARRRYGDAAGWLAAGLFMLLVEPAFYTGRILACSLQALLVAASLVLLQRAQSGGRMSAWVVAGLVLGAAVLAAPPMLLAIPAAVLLAAIRRPMSRATVTNAIAFAAGAVAAITPATVHNYLVSRELILVSAQAGVTFAQGNSPGAIGIYNQLPGVSRDRRQQNQDVLRIAKQERGPDAGWNDASHVFFARGTNFLREDPARAATLILQKLGWFVASSVYGDIYLPLVERAEGMARALWLAPLPLAWLAGLATCGMLLWLRRPIQFGPELILAAVPLITVLAFFYSPRYRFPIAPLAAIAAGGFIATMLSLAGVAQNGRRSGWLGMLLVALAAAAGPVISLVVTRSPGPLHDTVDSWRGPLRQKLAKIALDDKRYETAVAEARRAIELEPKDALSHQILAGGLEGLNQIDEALAHYRRVTELDPHVIEARFRLGEWLMRRGRPAEGLEMFDAAVQIAPLAPDAYLRRAQARAALGRIEQADSDVARAIALAREQGQEATADGYRQWWEKLKASAGRPR